MSNQFLKLRRSAVPGRIPTTSSLDLGEIALNTYDGLAFMKKSGSSGEEIVTLGTGTGGSGNITGSRFFLPVFNSTSSLTTSSFYQSGSFTGLRDTSPLDPTNPDILLVQGDGVNTYNLISAHGNLNSYTQLNVQNFNAGVSASSDIVATANTGTETSYYIDMGINSSNYNIAGGVGNALDAYLYANDTNLLIGSTAINKKVIIFTGGQNALANARVYIDPGGTVGINSSNITSGNPESLYIGAINSLTYNLITAQSDVNNYSQINIQNLSSGPNASSDFVATNDAGDESVNYIDMGINSSQFNANTVGGPNDAYLYSTGNDLYIGNARANQKVIIFNGGFDTNANAKIYIHPEGVMGINTNTFNEDNPAALTVRPTDATTNNLIQATSNVDNYTQISVANESTGTTASADIVAYNNIDPTNQLAGFIDMGIASTNYVRSDIYPSAAGDAYVFTDSHHLLLGATSASGATKITLFAGGINEIDNAKLILFGNNQHQMTGSLSISGSLANGESVVASGIFSHAEGVYTQSSGSYSHAEGSGAQALGFTSHAEGVNTQAIGEGSHAEGVSTTSTGFQSHAEGNSTVALGEVSHAEGTSTQSTGLSSHAEGFGTLSSGSYSHAEGNYTQAIGVGSHAEGSEFVGEGTTPLIAYGDYSHAEGAGTLASGSFSHAEGETTVARGQASHAEGSSTIASGVVSHAEGLGTTAQGTGAHSEGYSTLASGDHSHTEGYGSEASGFYSHAEGVNTDAIGEASHAEGFYTIASGSYQHVQGQYNIPYSDQSAFIIGNGVDGANRSNLVFASGSSFQITGSLQISGSITGSLLGTSSYAATASSADNFLVRGTLTAQTIVVQTITSSTDFVTGSTRFGTLLANTHQFTGSVSITGSLAVNGSNVVLSNQTGSMSVATASFASSSVSASFASTASYVVTALTASYVTASNIVGTIASSSFASTASYVVTAQTASYVTASNVIGTVTSASFASTASYVVTAQTASYVTASNVIGTVTSASYAISSSIAVSASFASTSSFYRETDPIFVAVSASLATTGSNTFRGNQVISGSLTISGSTTVTGSLNVSQGITSSLQGTASWANNAVTSSYILQAVSASFASTAASANTASYILNAVSSSFATNAANATTASYVLNAVSSSFAATASYANSQFDIGIAEFNSTSSTTTSGTTAISSIATGSFTSAFYNYTIASGSNARAGQVMSVWSGSTVRYTEVTTTDIGNTATASFAVAISGPNVNLSFTAPGVWTVKSIANLL